MDTYFLDYQDALKEAKEQNRFGTFNDLQICYFNGAESKHPEYTNLIPLPIDEFCNFMSTNPNRYVQNISYTEQFNQDQKKQLQHLLQGLTSKAMENKLNISNEYIKLINESTLDFNEPWRILFITTRVTTVLQYVAKNLLDAFNELGYDTFLSIEDNDMQTWGANSIGNPYHLWHLKNIYEYKPHIVFNLDHLNNHYLGNNIFNFIWFQDPVTTLYDDSAITLRKRDFIFTLLDEFKTALLNKNVPEEKIMPQHFATNPKIFFEDNTIKKENKIVFLGSDYNLDTNINISEDHYNSIQKHIEDNTLTNSVIKEFSQNLDISFDDFKFHVILSIVRRKIVMWLCSLKGISVEIYGTDIWLKNEIIAPFYKGLLPYGKQMAKVYNSATYALVAHPYLRYQQRLFEISSCNTIPVVYESHLMEDEEFQHKDNILSFSTFKELQNCIGKQPLKSPKNISEDISYVKLAERIIEITKESLKND